MSFETTIISIIEGRKGKYFLKALFFMLSQLYAVGLHIRNFLFDRKWIKVKHVSIPVLSIGNIVAGGTGKTALTQMLAQELKGFKQMAILSRGYRSKIEKQGGIFHLNAALAVTPELCGDEPYLLFKNLPHVSLFVGKDRRKSAEAAIQAGAKLILLDDGMQYRKLHRDLEIAILHADDPYGKGFYLPRGFLRDSPKRLSKADYIFVNHIQNEGHFEKIKEALKKHGSAPIIGTQMMLEGIYEKNGQKWEEIKELKIGAFCGLGNPHSFFKTLTELGMDIVAKMILPDHKTPSKKRLSQFIQLCKQRGGHLIVCSEKDWVKLDTSLTFPLPIAYTKAKLTVAFGRKDYTSFLDRLKNETLD